MIPHASLEALEERLSGPTDAVVEMMRRLDGDFLILGAAGKLGPSLTRMAKRASDLAGKDRRVIAVSRFGDSGVKESLEREGIQTIACDLLDAEAVSKLPQAPWVIYMAGMKFGATGQEPLTWAMNAWLPGVICQQYRHSRIAASSTGNVYGLVRADSGGSQETDRPQPVGEYAMSCLGRERLFEHFSQVHGTPVSLIRLNYACDLRYGVLVDIALKIWQGEPVDLGMGYLNTIWQGDANALSLLSLEQASSPAWMVNLTGRERLSVREVAAQLGALLDREVVLQGSESPDALLSDASRCFATLGEPQVTEAALLEGVAAWIREGGALLGKPTKFESRDGRF